MKYDHGKMGAPYAVSADPSAGFLNVIIGFNFKFSFSGQSSHIYV